MAYGQRRRLAGVSALLSLTMLGVTPAVRAAAPSAPSGARAVVRAGAVPAGDEVVSARVDTAGYHLFAASSGDGWAWHQLATLRPGGYDEQQWTGEQCLTGDGRYAVAVIAPWSASNSEAGINHGGLAYAIDAHTGAVRPLAGGVAPVYFNPGCGTGHQVALSAYAGPDQHPTVVSVWDAASGSRVRTTTAAAELTSAVPVSGRILAARGGDLVDATDAAHLTVLARLPNQVAELRPAADGGIDFLTQGEVQSTVWHWASDRLSRVATGGADGTHLFAGIAGRNLISGVDQLPAGSTLKRVVAPRAGIASVSSAGGLILAAQQASTIKRTGVAGDHVTAVIAATGRTVQADLAATGPAFAALPQAALVASGNADDSRHAGAAPADATLPTCAVARNDIFKQAWQPASNQVRWAVIQAVQGGLTAPRPAANASYTVNDSAYAPLPQAAPSADFPLAANGPTVPPLVMFGILAQESNWAQASWHATPGRAGNPLIGNYYGLSSGSSAIDFANADCGYGIGQLTDLMRMDPATGQPTAQQVRVAVDYATNIAAAVQALQSKWAQLHELGITLNNDDPTKIENWYAAIWAYNSGVHTEPNSAHGLGWLNNPANPIYPRRRTFLHDSTTLYPEDSKTPNHWPYQERVFGWMEVPQVDSVGYLRYHGTFDWNSQVRPTFLSTPGYGTFCSTTVNNCNPASVGTSSDPCPSESSSCWWDAPARWTDCTTYCTTDTPTTAPNNHTYYSPAGTPEPVADLSGYSTPIVYCDAPPTPGVGAVIVSEETLDSSAAKPRHNQPAMTPNLVGGCPQRNTAILPPATAHAGFQLLDARGNDVLTTLNSPAAIDLHQLGGGLGGHVFFTHTGKPMSPYNVDTDPEVKGVWTATLPADPKAGTAYEVKPFVPDVGATTGHATYEIRVCPTSDQCDDTVASQLTRTITQSAYTNTWASLGYALCGGAASGATSCTIRVTLRTTNPADDPTVGNDIAMNALAFVPAPTGGYVALGDSYSSGEGVAGTNGDQATYDDGTDTTENAGAGNGEPSDNGNLCHRSQLAWPRLFAAAENLDVVHLACSGSNLTDLTGYQYSFEAEQTPFSIAGQLAGDTTSYVLSNGNGDGKLYDGLNSSGPPWMSSQPNPDNAGSAFYSDHTTQIDVLRALKPKLVTLTIGGNDLGFADIIQTCMLLYNVCDQNFVGKNGDLIDKRIASLQSRLTTAYQQVKAAAPAANIYVLTYPAILATWPGESAKSVDCTGMTNRIRAWLAPKADTLNAAIKKAAASVKGITVIDTTSVFKGHEVCSDTRTLNATPTYITDPPNIVGLSSSNTQQRDNWYHPNQAGQQAISAYLTAQGVKPAP